MAKKVALISLGCAKNLINSEQMLRLIADAGFETVTEPEKADAIILNTCGFIESAKMEAIDNIIALGRLKTEEEPKKLIVTGCLPERYKDKLFEEMPEIDALVGTGSFGEIVEVLGKILSGDEKVSTYGDINAPVEETGRVISTGDGFAYIKIAEGCDNRCGYCVIPSLRGRFRSRPMENIIEEAKALADMGIQELIVVAQDITRYGIDNYGKRMLSELLKELCRIDGIEWIRLHYLYPDEIDDELIKTIAGNDKILKYLDIPIQHINDGILRLMNRRGTDAEIRGLFKKLRREIPGVVLRTSLITGLPGEGEAEFEELCDFLREARIERAGVFPLSPEEGTLAAKLEHPDEETATKRAELIMQLQDEVLNEFNKSRVGTKEVVMCDGFDTDMQCWYGRSYAESPDVDGYIWLLGEGFEAGNMYEVEITREIDGELVAEPVE